MWPRRCLIFFVMIGSLTNAASLLDNEKNTMAVFQHASSNVVFVHRLHQIINRQFETLAIPQGAGSGIVWDTKGHIVTNYHVVRGAEQLAVTLGELTVKARVIGSEPRKDIAVLEINSKNALAKLQTFKGLKIAEVSKLFVGQKALAIGNPFGLDHSLTVGVISALGRQVPGIGGVTIRDMIQTDASINPGNSGGPLLNSAGELIGMNTVIFSKSGTSAGIGFAVPADDMARIVNQIIKHGRVVLAGIGFVQVDSRLSRRLGIKKGVLIAQVLKNTPADDIGLKGTYRDGYGYIHIGDVIVGINGHPVDDYDDLYNLLVDVPVGKKITLKVMRGDKRMHYQIRTIDIAKKRYG